MAFIILLVAAVIASFPATWLLMLFVGNLGVGLSFWGALPAGILVTFFAAGAGAGGRSAWR
ncbi:MAG TPA: hypothetical protein VMI11_11110 [Actinomycetes bacterium]|nr:hypothetical protein [Actinomycetes bacterium]